MMTIEDNPYNYNTRHGEKTMLLAVESLLRCLFLAIM